MNRRLLDFWVGLFVIVGFAALTFLALQVGNLSQSSGGATIKITAEFANIGGLKVRAPVKSAGVVVGRVSKISYNDETGNAVVELNLEKKYKFTSDSSLSILTAGVLGEQYLGIETGGDTSAYLKEGSQIDAGLTNSAMILEQLIGAFMTEKAQESKSNPPEASASGSAPLDPLE